MEQVFEWDRNKARLNLVKHKVSFEEGKTIFEDPFLITFPDEFHSQNEDRLISIGESSQKRILLAVHVERLQSDKLITIRIISCRKATAVEKKIYEEKR